MKTVNKKKNPGLAKLPTAVRNKMGYKKSGGKTSKFKDGDDTHVTKDGRTVKKGLYYYMNKRKKSGTSRKGKGTVSDKALKQSKKTAHHSK
tara:strand:+ start:227 stop:499 length:273 start_codon:yes stop_codon:yes gene_type:complete